MKKPEKHCWHYKEMMRRLRIVFTVSWSLEPVVWGVWSVQERTVWTFIPSVRQLRDWQTISFPRTDRTKELQSHTIPVSCPRSFPMKQHFAWMQTGLRLIVLNPCVRHRNCHFPFVNLDVLQVSWLRQAIIRVSTTDTKYTGRMAHRLLRHTIKIFLQKWQKSLIFHRWRLWWNLRPKLQDFIIPSEKKWMTVIWKNSKNSRSTRKSSKRWQKISRLFTLRYMEQEISRYAVY